MGKSVSSLAPEPNIQNTSKLLSWIVTPSHLFWFFVILCSFHPLLMIARLFGLSAHDFFYKGMCCSLILNIRVHGTAIRFIQDVELPENRPIIFVSNHQCMYDVPYIIWFMRKHDPKFISKVELAKGIPSISYALRNGGHLLINRKDARGSVTAIQDFGKSLGTKTRSIAIFPEGTRARDGVLKRFKPGGFAALLRVAPSALIVPMVIDGSWEHPRHGFFPIPFGLKVVVRALAPIEQGGRTPEEVISEVEAVVAENLTEIRKVGGPAQPSVEPAAA